MGPLLPSMNPPPQGTRHCQRKTPAWAGLMKLNVSLAYGLPLVVHGDSLHRLFAESSAFGEATGTYRPMPGIANVCPKLQSDQALMTWVGLSVTYSVPCWSYWDKVTELTIVPCTWLKKLFRSGVQPS